MAENSFPGLAKLDVFASAGFFAEVFGVVAVRPVRQWTGTCMNCKFLGGTRHDGMEWGMHYCSDLKGLLLVNDKHNSYQMGACWASHPVMIEAARQAIKQYGIDSDISEQLRDWFAAEGVTL